MIHTHSHKFIQNKEVDALYFALSLLSFAEGMISIFVPIFLWSLGFNITSILLFYLLEAVYFVVLSLGFSRFLNRFTDKALIIAGVPFLVLYYGLIPLTTNLHWIIFVAPVFIALYRLTFNIGYHTDFTCASDGDSDDLGDEVGTQYMLVSLMQFAGPLLGGLLIATAGYGTTFWVATAVAAVALIPLLFFKGHKLSIDAITNTSVYSLIFSKEYRNLALASAGYALEATVGGAFWPLYIYLVFSSTKTVGGIYSSIALLMAVTSFIAGRFSNKERYGKIITYTVPFVALVWFIRVFFPGELTILITTPLKSILYAIMIVGWSGIYYLVAKKARPCGTLILACENIFTLSRVVSLTVLLTISLFVSKEILFSVMFFATAVTTLYMGRIAKQAA